MIAGSSSNSDPVKSRKARPLVLVADDDDSALQIAEEDLGEAYRVVCAQTVESALRLASKHPVDVVLLDIEMPIKDGTATMPRAGLNAIPEFRNACPTAEVVMFSHHDRAAMGVQAILRGAFDFVVKPYAPEELRAVIARALERARNQREVEYLREEVSSLKGGAFVFGTSQPMQRVKGTIESVAPTDAVVLISGETGTGKELVAREIHRRSERSDGPFVAVSVSALPRDLLSSTLFGHDKGAFTGAVRSQPGRFETATGGTLFLDEIGELDLDCQVKLLRVLQDGEYERVGSSQTRTADVRIIAATHRNLNEDIASGKFRKDLFFRLNVVPVKLPPLRERMEDLPELVHLFLERYASRFGRPIPEISTSVMNTFRMYEWPGNIRELEQLIQRLVALIKEGESITPETLPLEYRYPGFLRRDEDDENDSRDVLRDAMDAFERDFILKTLARCDWNRAEAARRLGIHAATLFRKLNKLGLYGTRVEPLQRNAGGRRFSKKKGEEGQSDVDDDSSDTQ